MARSYCDTDDVKQYLPPNIRTEGDNPVPNFRNPSPETVTNIDVDFFIAQACDNIDAELSTIYVTPIKQINQGGDVGYPVPIPMIAAIWAAQLIYNQPLQGADRQYSEAQKERWEWAQTQLIRIQNGEIRLRGQRNQLGDRFVRSNLRNIPHNPAEGGRSKGKNQ